jgi:cytochrome bd ubiquinol oxidase subunit I
MQHGVLSMLLARLDFAWITSMHILYPALTVGLSMALFVAEWRSVARNFPSRKKAAAPDLMRD